MTMTLPRILAIETSCDDTSVATLEGFQVRSNVVYTQVLHEQYGGVVPELASRAHMEALVPTVDSALKKAGWALKDVDAVAVTQGPGLLGSLLVGHSYAKSLALSLGAPLLNVHHMEAHMLAHFLVEPGIQETAIPGFPYLCLTVSGGHTQLVRVDGLGVYSLLGESLDDAAGEAFDKTAKLLGLSYPGGPAVSALAQQGTPDRFQFPRPMVKHGGLDFSFSGLKTHTLNTFKTCEAQGEVSDQDRADIALAFEVAVVDTLLIKCRRALEHTGLQRLVMAGGVSANRRLREVLAKRLGSKGIQVFYPEGHLCTDNGAMIALAGALRMSAGECDGPMAEVRARWPMAELAPPSDAHSEVTS